MAALKPHLPYDKQLDRLVSRGLTYGDRKTASSALRRIGYYRLSAYLYPFRKPAPTLPEHRGDEFAPGSTIEKAIALHAFDEKLRAALFAGLNIIEVGLAVRVGYILGKRDEEGHLYPDCLDEDACDETVAVGSGSDRRQERSHDVWVERYEKLKSAATQEDYLKHHILNYDSRVPIWVATEFLDFGSLVRLLRLMKKVDRKQVAAELGLARDSADTLHRWLKALNILRNHCAHNNRVWNRSTVELPPKFSKVVVSERLHHALEIEDAPRLKLYYLAALIAYLVTEIDPKTNWPRNFATVAKKLGDVNGMTLENTMGFPDGWASLELWNYDPAGH